MILGQIRTQDPARAMIRHSPLVQCEGDAADHTADELALHHSCVAAGGEGTDHARHTDLAQFRIDPDLGEHGTVGVHRIVRACHRIGRAAARGIDLGEAGARENVGIAVAPPVVIAAMEASSPRDRAGVAGAKQRRPLVRRCELRWTDCVATWEDLAAEAPRTAVWLLFAS